MGKTLMVGSILVLLITMLGWMVTQVSEYPGVKRIVETPSWFMNKAPDTSPSQGETSTPAKEAIDETYHIVTGTTVEIGFKEYKLLPNQILIQVASLPVTIAFILNNQGRFSHDFRLKGHDLSIKTPKFAPRHSHEFQLTFEEPGEYEISCPLSNHAERGMRGTLVIQVKG